MDSEKANGDIEPIKPVEIKRLIPAGHDCNILHDCAACGKLSYYGICRESLYMSDTIFTGGFESWCCPVDEEGTNLGNPTCGGHTRIIITKDQAIEICKACDWELPDHLKSYQQQKSAAFAKGVQCGMTQTHQDQLANMVKAGDLVREEVPDQPLPEDMQPTEVCADGKHFGATKKVKALKINHDYTKPRLIYRCPCCNNEQHTVLRGKYMIDLQTFRGYCKTAGCGHEVEVHVSLDMWIEEIQNHKQSPHTHKYPVNYIGWVEYTYLTNPWDADEPNKTEYFYYRLSDGMRIPAAPTGGIPDHSLIPEHKITVFEPKLGESRELTHIINVDKDLLEKPADNMTSEEIQEYNRKAVQDLIDDPDKSIPKPLVYDMINNAPQHVIDAATFARKCKNENIEPKPQESEETMDDRGPMNLTEADWEMNQGAAYTRIESTQGIQESGPGTMPHNPKAENTINNNHDDHYKAGMPGLEIESIELMESKIKAGIPEEFHATLVRNFHISMAFKYLIRCGSKDKPEKELDKALNYLHRARHGEWR